MNITLPPDIEQALIEEARRLGTTPEKLALESLRSRFVSTRGAARGSDEATTLADFLSGSIGVLRSSDHLPGGARLSEESHKKYAAALLRRHRQGRR